MPTPEGRSGRDAGDLLNLPYMLAVIADLDMRAGHFQDAAAHLRDGLQIAVRAGDLWDVAANGLFFCALLCTATGRYAEAATVWAAQDVHAQQLGLVATSPGARMREEALRTIRQVLGDDRARAAEDRGASMSLATATEYALLLTTSGLRPQAAPELAGLSVRERELVTLVARGRTDAQIAAELFISIRTVRSHLDRIRDKSGCRRRADLTALADGWSSPRRGPTPSGGCPRG